MNQGFARVSFFGGNLRGNIQGFLGLFPSHPPSEGLRESLRGVGVTETLATVFRLDEEEDFLGWWWPSHRFDFAHTVCA